MDPISTARSIFGIAIRIKDLVTLVLKNRTDLILLSDKATRIGSLVKFQQDPKFLGNELYILHLQEVFGVMKKVENFVETQLCSKKSKPATFFASNASTNSSASVSQALFANEIRSKIDSLCKQLDKVAFDHAQCVSLIRDGIQYINSTPVSFSFVESDTIILGEGRFGKVEKVSAFTNIEYAVKTINLVNCKKVNNVSFSKTSLVEEVQKLVSLLHHIHISQYFGVAASPNDVQIAMEPIDGVKMSTKYSTTAKSTARQVHIWLLQLSSALEFIHAHGVMHRDLTGDKIIIFNSVDHIKLIDFGFEAYGRRMYETGDDIYAAGVVFIQVAASRTLMHRNSLDNFLLRCKKLDPYLASIMKSMVASEDLRMPAAVIHTGCKNYVLVDSPEVYYYHLYQVVAY